MNGTGFEAVAGVAVVVLVMARIHSG